jgi:hypothetical protein
VLVPVSRRTRFAVPAPTLRDRHESGPDIRAFDHLDVDAQHRAVDRGIVFEARVEL